MFLSPISYSVVKKEKMISVMFGLEIGMTISIFRQKLTSGLMDIPEAKVLAEQDLPIE